MTFVSRERLLLAELLLAELLAGGEDMVTTHKSSSSREEGKSIM